MKIILSLTTILIFVLTSCAQSKKISKAKYDKVIEFAVTKTNEDYPLVFKVDVNFIENGKIVREVNEINENESEAYYRIKKTILENGKETSKFQITYGYGKVYCSDDGVKWLPSEYECNGAPMMLYGDREAKSVEYSVTEKLIKDKKVKVYREYSVFAPLEGSEKKEFREEVSTIDSRGFFINIVGTEGTLDPTTVTLKREQSWITKAKFKKIVPPDQK